MGNQSNLSRKIPVRSVMSDKELASLIRQQREMYPDEFEIVQCVSDTEPETYNCCSSANKVISKWL